MSTATANLSAIAATIPRAVFNFGTQTYTAIQTAGPSQAAIGQNTLTAGGAALQLDGGYASLASNGLIHVPGSINSTLTTSTSVSQVVVTGRRVELTLASATVVYLAPTGAVLKGTKSVATSLEWVIGQQTLIPVYNGVVVASGSERETFKYSLTNITRAAAATSRVRMPVKSLEGLSVPAATSSSSEVASVRTTAASMLNAVASAILPATSSSSAVESAAMKSLETSSLSASSAATSMMDVVASAVTEPATITDMPSNESPRSGGKLAWMAKALVLVSLLAI